MRSCRKSSTRPRKGNGCRERIRVGCRTGGGRREIGSCSRTISSGSLNSTEYVQRHNAGIHVKCTSSSHWGATSQQAGVWGEGVGQVVQSNVDISKHLRKNDLCARGLFSRLLQVPDVQFCWEQFACRLNSEKNAAQIINLILWHKREHILYAVYKWPAIMWTMRIQFV